MLNLTDEEPDIMKLDRQSKSIVKYAFQMDNRDPKDINSHITVLFEDTLGEPEGVRSADCLWRNSYRCFNAWKSICYHINTILCGLCIAMYWGCEFAFVAFFHVWFIGPCLRCVDINTNCIKKFTGLCCWCLIHPCVDAIARLIRVYKE